ncbi:hypothetical protein OF117_06475 [Geodermatophilus sp. YIM 151500]|uniref:hypothetical protein n=1 Tax=Geodermatophilus sp. YIM 151500 TaxID=2984531 RepID=UPI0021E4615C|nr:hypothetical protein [Geodermatophilus sp. YIM 151500]MCV2489003.1 hypothetical protein [Geodermatophilus sp. YIM 151500]
MTQPSPARPVPGPPRPGAAAPAAEPEEPREDREPERLADLAERPVAEHVAVFEAEHARLQRELGSIDPL